MSSQSKITKDLEEIRRWAEERGGTPSHVTATASKDDVGILRIDFPGFSGEMTLEPISWDQWFQKFMERGLALVYQEQTAEGEKSNFNKIVSAESIDEEPSSGVAAEPAARKRAAKKIPAKSAAKKTVSAKGAAKKSAPVKALAKKAAAKKGMAAASYRKAAPKKAVATKSAAKKTAVKKAIKKAAPRKALKKTGLTKRAVKTVAKKKAVKKAAAKKTVAKKSASRRR